MVSENRQADIGITPDMARAGITPEHVKKISHWIKLWGDPSDEDSDGLASELGISDPDDLWSPRPVALKICEYLLAQLNGAARESR